MKKKEYRDDDGRTIANMNVEGFRWYNPQVEKKEQPVFLSKSDRRAVFFAGLKSFLLPAVCVLAGGIVAFLLCYFLWLW